MIYSYFKYIFIFVTSDFLAYQDKKIVNTKLFFQHQKKWTEFVLNIKRRHKFRILVIGDAITDTSFRRRLDGPIKPGLARA